MTGAARPPERLHMIGICGTGMAGLAIMLGDLGYAVSGSDDAIYPPMSEVLAARGIAISPFSPDNVRTPLDGIVLGAGVSRRNAEFIAATGGSVPVYSFPEAITRFILPGHAAHVVAGTHGKTTTASMLALIHHTAGTGAGMFIGGVPRDFGEGARLPGAGAPLIIEGDEYKSSNLDLRPKFSHYRPAITAITNVEFDHGDVFADFRAVLAAFVGLVAATDADGAVATTAHDAVLGDLRAAARCRFVTVGRSAGRDWRIVDAEGGKGFAVISAASGRRLGPVVLQVPGEHNVRNAALAAIAAHEAGIDEAAIVRGLAAFSGVKRRLEVLCDHAGIRVVDDFAHHPSEVAASLSALRQAWPGRRLWAIFEPRSATSRTRRFQHDYAEVLALADRVTIIAVPPSRYGAPVLDCEALAAAITAKGREAAVSPTPEAVFPVVREGLAPGLDLVVMSSGALGGLAARLAAGVVAHAGGAEG